MYKINRSSVAIFVIILLVNSIQTFAQNTALNSNEKEKNGLHSAIVEANGYAYLAEDKTIRQIREEALANAKRDALEKGQTYIQSFTKVENFQLTYDLIQSAAEGFVKILESKDLGITSENRYHYWIKAEIEYRLTIPGNENAAEIQASPSAPLNVRVWTDKLAYQTGESIKIFLKGNKDCYARIIYVNARKEILQLLPNLQRTDNFIKAGQVVSVPDVIDGFKLEVAAPFGKEQIIVYASSAPQGNVNTAPFGDAVLKVQSDIETACRGARSVIFNKKAAAESAEFFETSCLIETKGNK